MKGKYDNITTAVKINVVYKKEMIKPDKDTMLPVIIKQFQCISKVYF